MSLIVVCHSVFEQLRNEIRIGDGLETVAAILSQMPQDQRAALLKEKPSDHWVLALPLTRGGMCSTECG